MRLEELTVERVRELYAKHCMVPCAHEAIPKGGRCCALGILGQEAGVDYDKLRGSTAVVASIADKLGVAPRDAKMFAFGFDDGMTSKECDGKDPWYVRGYEVGEALR